MRKRTRFPWRALMTAGAITVGATYTLAAGANLYYTGFEPGKFSLGAISGQDHWRAYNFSQGVVGFSDPTNAAHVVGADEFSGRQVLCLDGSRLAGYQNPIVEADKSVGYRATNWPTPVVILEAEIRLDGPASSGNEAVMSFGISDSDGYALATWQISSGGTISAFGFVGDQASSSGSYGATATLGTYYRVGVELNYTSGMITFLLEGQAVGTVPINPSSASGALGGFGGRLWINQYSYPAADPTQYKGLMDNCSVTAALFDPSVPVTIRSFEFRPDGSRFIDGIGQPNGTVRIEACDDMQSFSNVATLMADDAGHFEWNDGSAATHRFYRASSP